jgi:uncharacterized protein
MIFKKEREVIRLITDHVEKVEECISTGEKTLISYISGDKSEAKRLSRHVDSLETEADYITETIRDRLYSGAYLPLLREDIYRLVEQLDKVANAMEACCDFFLNQRPSIPEEFKPHLIEIIKKSTGTVVPLKEAVMCFLEGACPEETTRKHVKDAGIQESEVDKLEWNMTKLIFTSPMEHSYKIHLKQCLNTIVEISDRAEDTADHLELVTLKAMF